MKKPTKRGVNKMSRILTCEDAYILAYENEKFSLEEILSTIEGAAKHGEFELGIPAYKLTKETAQQLSALGFTVFIPNDRRVYRIYWDMRSSINKAL